jgi:Cdc6-like AAA superfamily ATPase
MASAGYSMMAAIFAQARQAAESLKKALEDGAPELTYSQWSKTSDGSAYTPVGNTIGQLKPGYYDLGSDQGQIFFMKIRARTDDLIKFPDSQSAKVLDGIRDFWDREKLFKKYGLPYKRGILMHGPPGSGKSCTLQLVAREVVERGGVVLTYNPGIFLAAYRAFRDIQPDTHIVVLMEDFESLLKNYESRLLNLLDGVEDLDKVVFLATTNYPEMLQARIVNRPSRFDLVVRVPHPSVESRKMYLSYLVQDDDAASIDVDKYAEDTKELSLAHTKELFVATVILGNEYDKTLKRLKDMDSNKPSSLDGDDTSTGFFL